MIKLTDQEIEKQISEKLFLAGQKTGNAYPYIYQAEKLAQQHSQYELKYKKTISVLKSIYEVSRLGAKKV